MWVDIISFSIHWLMALAFFMLIPLPFFLKGMQGENLIFIKKLYRPIIHFGHAALIGTIITGVILLEVWISWWIAVVFLLWVVIGALLGLTAKSLRHSQDTGQSLKYSSFLTGAIVVMFLLKFSNWYF